MRLPRLLNNERKPVPVRECPAHRAWVRRHHCCVTGCANRSIECAHVRTGTDGGVGLKPSDRWTISLCSMHHAEQHRLGEKQFGLRHGLDLHALAAAFAGRSPYHDRLRDISADRGDVVNP
jgi:hypothetical protein